MKKAPHATEIAEQAVLAEAVIWTAFVQLAPGDRRKAEYQTRGEAQDAAKQAAAHFSRPVMIYGVNKEGRSALAEVIRA